MILEWWGLQFVQRPRYFHRVPNILPKSLLGSDPFLTRQVTQPWTRLGVKSSPERRAACAEICTLL
jgi:hypothetical protein